MPNVSAAYGLGYDPQEGVQKVAMLRWDTGTLQWVKVTGGTTTGPDVNVTNFPANYPVLGISSINAAPALAQWIQSAPAVCTNLDASYNPGDLVPLSVDPSGHLRTSTDTKSNSCNISRISASVVNQTLLAANGARIGLIVHNESDSNLKLKFGAVASAISYTYELHPHFTLEIFTVNWIGQIDGIWDVATGAAQVTELLQI